MKGSSCCASKVAASLISVVVGSIHETIPAGLLNYKSRRVNRLPTHSTMIDRNNRLEYELFARRRSIPEALSSKCLVHVPDSNAFPSFPVQPLAIVVHPTTHVDGGWGTNAVVASVAFVTVSNRASPCHAPAITVVLRARSIVYDTPCSVDANRVGVT